MIDVVPPPDEQLAFDDLPGIDAGEAVLFSATAHYRDARVATGDKRSLIALATAGGPVCTSVRARLAGRIVCFEQIVVRLIDRQGFDWVGDRVVPARGCDTALRLVFGSGLTADEPGVRGGLASYIHDLRGSTGGLLGR